MCSLVIKLVSVQYVMRDCELRTRRVEGSVVTLVPSNRVGQIFVIGLLPSQLLVNTWYGVTQKKPRFLLTSRRTTAWSKLT